MRGSRGGVSGVRGSRGGVSGSTTRMSTTRMIIMNRVNTTRMIITNRAGLGGVKLQLEVGTGAEKEKSDGLFGAVANLVGRTLLLSHSQRGRFTEGVMTGCFFDLQHKEGVSHRFSLLIHHIEGLRFLVDSEAERNKTILQVGKQKTKTQILHSRIFFKFVSFSIISLHVDRFILQSIHGNREEFGGIGGKHPTSNAK